LKEKVEGNSDGRGHDGRPRRFAERPPLLVKYINHFGPNRGWCGIRPYNSFQAMPELTVDNARFRHFRSVRWILPGGPLRAEAYHPVVEGDECPGCLVCERTIGWFMEFARIGRELVVQLQDAYYAIAEGTRPFLEDVWPDDQGLSQSERFEDRLAIVERMVELWEDGQYVGKIAISGQSSAFRIWDCGFRILQVCTCLLIRNPKLPIRNRVIADRYVVA